MARNRQQPEGVAKITFRVFQPYGERVAACARDARLSPNQLARIATMSLVDSGLLNLNEKIGSIEQELKRLRREIFPDAREHDSATH